MRATPHYPDSSAPTPTMAIRFAVASLLASLLLTACGSRETRPTRPAAAPVTKPTRDWTAVAPADPGAANAVLMRAISLVGTPYRYGGNTPEGGFDCSGLVNYVFRDMLDLRLPRTSRDLFAYQGPKIEPARLTTGDLVFFGSGGSVSHVGIYIGEGRFVHAPSTGGTVRLDHLDGSYWLRNYSGSKRVLQ